MSDTFCARLSPGGRAAIGVAGVWGSGAQELVMRHFQTAARGARAATRAQYGRFVDAAGEVIDDGLLLPIVARSDPPAYLITLHGNPILLARLLDVLKRAGARESVAPWFRWLGFRGDPEGEGRRIADEAVELLPRARTAAAAAFLLEQRSTGLARWFNTAAARAPGEAELQALLDRAPRGRGLFELRRVVLSGVPNAGKSTLFNRLLGRARVVTHPAPGTTRDIIEEEVLWGDYPVVLVDGAGLRDGATAIEREGVLRMHDARRAADLVIDLRPPPTLVAGADDAPSRGEEAGPAPKILAVRSRADEEDVRSRLARPDLLRISGVTGEGLESLATEVLTRLFGADTLPRGVPVPFLARHEEVLRRALDAARRA